jgi:predicted small integral membrane protein
MLRIFKILLVLSVASWGLLGAFGNILDWSGTTGAVTAATSMTTFDGGADNWRATSNPAIIIAGALAIVFFKSASAILCLIGAWQMWTVRAGEATAFAKAKTYALAGCAVAIFMLFSGWIVIAETWFELWRSEVMREAALDAAFRYCGMIGLIALFVGMHDE